MAQEIAVFNGGESPLGAKVRGDSAAHPGQSGATQTDGGSAPSGGAEKGKAAPAARAVATGEPPAGGVVRARTKKK